MKSIHAEEYTRKANKYQLSCSKAHWASCPSASYAECAALRVDQLSVCQCKVSFAPRNFNYIQVKINENEVFL